MSDATLPKWNAQRIRDLEARFSISERSVGALKVKVEVQRREVEELKSRGFDRMVLLEEVTVRLAERIEALEDKLSGG